VGRHRVYPQSPRLKAKTLFATHYHELVELASSLPYVRNYNVAVAEEGDRVVFLHKIVPGGADRSYGIHVAQLAGCPSPSSAAPKSCCVSWKVASARTRPARREESAQLSLFVERDPVLDALKALDVNSLSPLEALTKLYELQKLARGS